LANTTARLQANTLCVQLANPRAEDWLRHRLHPTIQRTARHVFNQPDLAITYHTEEQGEARTLQRSNVQTRSNA
jgi:hypothetical protein